MFLSTVISDTASSKREYIEMKSSDIRGEFSTLKSADQCSVRSKFFHQTREGRLEKKGKEGRGRSAMVSEAGCEPDRSTRIENEISTDCTFAHMV